jgi:hypothetical protein
MLAVKGRFSAKGDYGDFLKRQLDQPAGMTASNLSD